MTHLVVGGGIMGLLTAYYLNAEGETVTVIEQGKLGRESSWAGGGILSPLYPWRYPDPLNDLAAWSQAHYPELIDRLHVESNIDAQWIQSGMMVLDGNEVEPAVAWAERNNIALELLSTDKVQKNFPTIQQNVLADKSIWMPTIAQVRNPRLLKALIGALKKKGVTLLEDTPVTDFCIEDQAIVGIKSHEQKIESSSVTVACGAWSSCVLQKWLPTLNVEPVRGQMLLYKATPETLKTIILRDSHYLIPRKDGRIIVGSTLEFVGFDKQTTTAARETLAKFAVNLVPALDNFPIEHHWAGLRPGNSVKTPLVSNHPSVKGLFINTGHYRNGVVTAPASARLCADLILGKTPVMNALPYKV